MSGTIVDHLRGKRRIHIDSMVVIYFIEWHPTYGPLVRTIFELVDRRELVGLSSYITLLEIMVQPLRQGRSDLVKRYRDTLVESRRFSLFPVDQAVAEDGAEIRARYAFRTPDAIQLATAVLQRADVFVTNDTKLRRFDRVEVLVLDDFVEHPVETKGQQG